MFGRPRKGVREELEREGTRAYATVLEIAERGMSITSGNNVAGAEASVKTRLEVHPPDGMPSFEVRESFRYSQFSIPSVGDRLTVIYDPDDHDRIMLDESSPIVPGRAVAGNIPGPGHPQLGQLQPGQVVGGLDLGALIAQVSAAKAAGEGPDALAEQLRGMFPGATVISGGEMTMGTAMAPPMGATHVDPLDRLAKAAALHQQGVLTDAEFAELKAQILAGG